MQDVRLHQELSTRIRVTAIDRHTVDDGSHVNVDGLRIRLLHFAVLHYRDEHTACLRYPSIWNLKESTMLIKTVLSQTFSDNTYHDVNTSECAYGIVEERDLSVPLSHVALLGDCFAASTCESEIFSEPSQVGWLTLPD